jgi:mono/diheme cytochrome c family protein
MQTRISSASVVVLAGGAAVILTIAGCRNLPPSTPASQFTLREARGAQVFQQSCSRCHYPNTRSGLRGPGLQALTKLPSMPSGAPPTDERMSYTILHGHGTMPGTPLSGADLQDLLAYLHTL